MPSGAIEHPPAPAPASATDRLRSWRHDQLLRGGYPPDEAQQLADRLDVDLHGAVELVRRGCPVETAVRILL